MIKPPVARFQGVVWRTIPSRFPPVDLFKPIAPPEDWARLQALEDLTNERLVEQTAPLGYVRPEDKIAKSSSNYIMAPFTHPNPDGSRFSNGTYGVLYAGFDLETAAAETKVQTEEFLRRTSEAPQRLDMRAIAIDLEGQLFDLRGDAGKKYTSHEASLELAKELRNEGAYGLVYDSVARPGGSCVCIFRPPVLSNCRQERHFTFVWDGTNISDVFGYERSKEIFSVIGAGS